ncbi:MAG: spore germination protein GerW family protein [Armatimonadota bacterium]|nr:spore germination protein GerW family protein [Armatimonadota bacterium]MDR7533007.1 spore germination protein GerW family protein [Armatimonadota bacterium]MDR7536821.1 spore germination protein GerW family protein [Armatimonadota bacterium]
MLEDLIGRIARIDEQATVKTVFGDPIRADGRTLVPVARVAYGFGFGLGRNQEKEQGTEETGEGGGGGGGAWVRPMAVLEITDAGTRVRPIVDVTRLVLAGLALVAWNVFWVAYTVRAVERARARRA